EVPHMNYRPVDGWGRLPEGWSYVEATSVAVDQKDNVYVFNRGTHPIIVFDREGRFLRSWGEGVFRRPHGVTPGPDPTLWPTACRSSTARGGISRSSTTCTARAGSAATGETAASSSSASCRRTCR